MAGEYPLISYQIFIQIFENIRICKYYFSTQLKFIYGRKQSKIQFWDIKLHIKSMHRLHSSFFKHCVLPKKLHAYAYRNPTKKNYIHFKDSQEVKTPNTYINPLNYTTFKLKTDFMFYFNYFMHALKSCNFITDCTL